MSSCVSQVGGWSCLKFPVLSELWWYHSSVLPIFPAVAMMVVVQVGHPPIPQVLRDFGIWPHMYLILVQPTTLLRVLKTFVIQLSWICQSTSKLQTSPWQRQPINGPWNYNLPHSSFNDINLNAFQNNKYKSFTSPHEIISTVARYINNKTYNIPSKDNITSYSSIDNIEIESQSIFFWSWYSRVMFFVNPLSDFLGNQITYEQI